MSRPNLAVAGFADTVERYYHGPAGTFAQVPPMGMRTAGQPGETSPAFTKPFESRKLDGTPLFKNQVRRVNDTADPNTMIRNYLEAQPIRTPSSCWPDRRPISLRRLSFAG